MNKLRVLVSFDFTAEDCTPLVRELGDRIAENMGGSVVRRSVRPQERRAEVAMSVCRVAARYLVDHEEEAMRQVLYGCLGIELELGVRGLRVELLTRGRLDRQLADEGVEC